MSKPKIKMKNKLTFGQVSLIGIAYIQTNPDVITLLGFRQRLGKP